ncbi:metallophosphoesterase [Jannaschia sp. M317]|uniref:metallophosphoesterase n=1 Tax=Jannaschia sp. M317 TaxID=2867011 RepID=UPI0021A895B6|nr:metallophosphoesterase [Jannaschia sp. M317]UWQ16479.1 hypothetical protein K3551_11185 [Jannaschia sp. M317]
MRPLFLSALTVLASPALAEPFAIVALGDAPYGDPAEVYAPFETLIDTINATAPDLVLHVGDTKSGGTECSDQMLDDQLAFLNRFAAPTLYAPGDNEWTDCHRAKAGGFDPLDRLDRIRQTYFAAPETSFGMAHVTVESQADAGYPENARLMHKDVMVMTAHVVGSNNNFEVRDPAAVAEFFARDAANVTWLRDSFAAAQEAEALVLAIHADMFEFDFGPAWSPEGWLRHSGFQNFGPALIEEAAAFGKPVLLIYGDSHRFRQSRPFADGAPNLMAVEVPGAANMHALTIGVDTDAPGIFSVSLLRNPALDG